MYWNDLAWWTYLFTGLISAYGALLFAWWMAKNKFHTSAVFAYTMLWIAGTGLQALVELYARMLTLQNPQLFADFSRTYWWPLRRFIILTILITLCIHMSIRAITWARKNKKHPMRRQGDG